VSEYKPHVVLHIGSSKTGSTALQTACRKHSKALLAAGVLYPEVRSHPVSHHFLGMLVRPVDEQARAYGGAFADSPDLLRADFISQWRSVQRQVQRLRPKVLLLSSETLFILPQPEGAEQLRLLLEDIAGSLEIVAYIRRPSAFYLSRVQQDLKHSGAFVPPGPVLFREVIESWERLLKAPVKVAAFARESLLDGDIFRDFVSRYLPQVNLTSALVADQENQTLSAELMALLQDYHRTNHPHPRRWGVEDSRRFRLLLQKIDHQDQGFRRPQLRADLVKYIDCCSTDLLWLESRYGVRFVGLDMALVGTVEHGLFAGLDKVCELCEVDSVRKERMLLLAMHKLLRPRFKLPGLLDRWRARYLNSAVLRILRRLLLPLRRKFNAWL
jgi:hypothetical protein